MRIFTVSGAHGGVGKTTLASMIIRRLGPCAAIKVSTTAMYATVTDDLSVVMEDGKDTAHMREAGAHPVVLVSCPREDLDDSMAMALDMVNEAAAVVIEGNSAVRLIKPDRAFFVIGAEVADAKPDSLDVLAMADVVVVNVEADEPPSGLVDALRAHNAGARVVTMGRLKGSDGAMDEMLG